MNGMSGCGAAFVRKSVSLLTEDYLPALVRALEPLGADDVWWRPNDASNSIGNLLLHLRGNVTQWIIGGVAGRPFARRRQEEFDARDGVPAAVLLGDLSATVREAADIIAAQTASTLLERRAIQGYDVSVLDAIYHVVEHFSTHTGQIILLAKARTGTDLRLWTPPGQEQLPAAVPGSRPNPAAAGLRVISSMATRRLLGDLIAAFAPVSPQHHVSVESVGGLDAARRVDGGEPFDVVVLAADALDGLIARGRVRPGSRVDLVTSPIALAVRSGAPRPDISSEDAMRRAVLAARSIGYSTGPSGDHLVRLLARWGIADTVGGRLVQAPPGVAVATLVADGDVELGVQQLSELMPASGNIDVVGLLPAGVQHVTTFAAGITATCEQPEAARTLLAFLASPSVAAIKRRHGMEPA